MIMFSRTQTRLPSLNIHDLTYNHTNSVMLAKYSVGAFMHRYNSKKLHILCICMHSQNISGTSGKNYFYKMNGDVGMAGW